MNFDATTSSTSHWAAKLELNTPAPHDGAVQSCAIREIDQIHSIQQNGKLCRLV